MATNERSGAGAGATLLGRTRVWAIALAVAICVAAPAAVAHAHALAGAPVPENSPLGLARNSVTADVKADPLQAQKTLLESAFAYGDLASDGAYATRGGGKAASEAFHYTFNNAVQSIERQGLRPGSYATPNGVLSPLQAQIDLALSPNRGLRDALLRVDLAGLRKAGYQIPEVTQAGRSFGMPGGGLEMQFPYAIPPEFIRVIRP
jgi:hypothetical protein